MIMNVILSGVQKQGPMNMLPHAHFLRRIGLLVRFIVLLACLAAYFLPVHAAVATPNGPLIVTLDQLSTRDEGCQLMFVVNNQTGVSLERLQVETVLFSPENRVLAMTMLDFQTSPDSSLRVRNFAFPTTSCAQIGSVLFNAVGSCAPLDSAACEASLQVGSHVDAELIQ